MTNLFQAPTLILFTLVGAWDEPGATETETVHSLQRAGYVVQIARDSAESLALLDTVKDAIVIADWQAFGISRIEDFYQGVIYNPFWEWRHAVEARRVTGHLIGLITLYHYSALSGNLDWFGAPSAVTSDMFLGYPFSSQVLAKWLTRLIDNPHRTPHYLWDDRRPV